MSLEIAILETLAYSDIFDFPLTIDELHRFLVQPASLQDLDQCAAGMKDVDRRDGYFYLRGREEIVEIRKHRQDASRKVFKRAIIYGRILAVLPFIRMVALTGSLTMLNLSKDSDIDFMLVAAHGYVWTARAFAILLGRVTRLFGDTLCPNLIVSERALEWPLHDLYSAREFCQMVPIAGKDVYLHLLSTNSWMKAFLPNANPIWDREVSHKKESRFDIFESMFRTKIGLQFESWEMKRKIARFSRQAGFGEETVFTADVCQGNFDHHRKWTEEAYKDRLSSFGLQFEAWERAPAVLENELSRPKVNSANAID